jgi:CheY-like chemotaxis protein
MSTLVFCEDDPTIRKLIQVALRATPHAIYIAVDGGEGLTIIERERPDLICTDVRMPVLDGLELAAAVRDRPDLAHIPIVFMTASAQRGELERVFESGAMDCLIKPFTPTDLRDMIDKHIPGSS